MVVIDSSALVKRYIDEPGRQRVTQEMNEDTTWVASGLCFAETSIAICRTATDPASAQARLEVDREFFVEIPVDDLCLRRAGTIGCEHRVRTLDAIHLAAASLLPSGFRFLTFDVRQAVAARMLGFDVVDTGV